MATPDSSPRQAGEKVPTILAHSAGSDNATSSVSPDDNVSYEPSSVLSCPPLLQLQMYGMCCPFIETEEEHDARIGASHLQNYPITWYRKKLLEDVANDVKGAVSASRASGQVGGMMHGLGKLLGEGGKKAEIPMVHQGVPAIMSIADTNDHGPMIEIRSLEVNDPSNASAREAVNGHITGGKPWWEDIALREKAPSKVIPLYMVDKVSTGWSISNDKTTGGVRLYAASTSKGFLSGSGPELLRFDTLGGGGNTMRDYVGMKQEEPNKYSDKVIVQLKSLVDWNRRRVSKDIKRGRVGVVPKANSQGGSDYVEMK